VAQLAVRQDLLGERGAVGPFEDGQRRRRRVRFAAAHQPEQFLHCGQCAVLCGQYRRDGRLGGRVFGQLRPHPELRYVRAQPVVVPAVPGERGGHHLPHDRRAGFGEPFTRGQSTQEHQDVVAEPVQVGVQGLLVRGESGGGGRHRYRDLVEVPDEAGVHGEAAGGELAAVLVGQREGPVGLRAEDRFQRLEERRQDDRRVRRADKLLPLVPPRLREMVGDGVEHPADQAQRLVLALDPAERGGQRRHRGRRQYEPAE